ncbi:hypothetical protein [Streptomyces turgidiscabies]|uniref:Lipoprotein n=1 Tax=Streptomyces turgidiscabies TaxID=85558 RepID=A0ABU0RE68_9ACTN|nr:hypothetical protein [Streptomyces turgidiscabies]MDQ0930254.1 hypothetical protein [Streptomyces turgidiscabies]
MSALKATMPGIEMNENSSADDCGGPDVIDSKDSSKRIGSTVITIPGDPSDKRQAKTLVQEAANYLTSHGWTVEKKSKNPPAGHPDGIVMSLKKPGTAGGVDISAWPFKLTSGKISQTFGATIATDCLRNPVQGKERERGS